MREEWDLPAIGRCLHSPYGCPIPQVRPDWTTHAPFGTYRFAICCRTNSCTPARWEFWEWFGRICGNLLMRLMGNLQPTTARFFGRSIWRLASRRVEEGQVTSGPAPPRLLKEPRS